MTSTTTVLQISTSNVTQPWNNTNTTATPLASASPLVLSGRDIAWLILSIFTIITNSLFLLLIVSVKNLRKVSNSFIASMSLVGILWAVMYLLPRFAFSSTLNQNWFYCSLTPILGTFFTIVINLHLCLISLDKYFAIIFPFSYLKYATNFSIGLSVVVVWILPLTIAIIPPLSFREFDTGICVIFNFGEPDTERIYSIIVFALLFFVPIICMIFAYGHIFWVANKHLKLLMDRDGSSQRVFLNIKAAKYLSLIVSVFLITWLPYVIYFFIIFLNPSVLLNQELLFGLRFLAFSYPCINPVIYGFFQSDLRRQITKNLFHRNNRVEILTGSHFGVSNSRVQ